MELQAKSSQELQQALDRVQAAETRIRDLEERQRQFDEQEQEAERLRVDLSDAIVRSRELATEVEELKRELVDAKDAHESDLLQMQNLQAERSQLLSGLGDARTSEDQLAAQLLGVQAELALTLAALEEAQADRDQALRNQSADAVRLIRDHLTEADGDRAVLEHQNLTLAKEIEDLRKQSESEVASAKNSSAREIDGLKAELGLAKAQLREAQRLRTKLQDELGQERDALTYARKETIRQREIGRDAIRAASSFHDCVSRLHSAIQSSATISGSSVLIHRSGSGPVQAAGGENQGHQQPSLGVTLSESPDMDESESALLHELAALKTYDLATFSDAVTRTMSLVKKWQKSCKQYRDKAKDKLAFSNFSKGDLALFLPTRNSTVKPWAAFNISSPHNFLKPTPAMEEQIKVRDWIVARIVKIEEDVVDNKRPGSNPYELAEGIRFFILHVEQYTPPPPSRARRSSSNNMLEPGTTAPLPTSSTLTNDVALSTSAPITELRQTDYFSTPSVPGPVRRLSAAAAGEAATTSTSPQPPTPQEGMLPPPMTSTLASATARRSSAAPAFLTDNPHLSTRQPSISAEARRPPSIASSNGSFRGGIQYASSNKAASVVGVTRGSMDPPSRAGASAFTSEGMGGGGAGGAGGGGGSHQDSRSMSPVPNPTINPSTNCPTTTTTTMPGSFRPRLGSLQGQGQAQQGGLGAFLRRDSGTAAAASAGGGGGGGGGASTVAPTSMGGTGQAVKRPVGMGQGALDILRNLEG